MAEGIVRMGERIFESRLVSAKVRESRLGAYTRYSATYRQFDAVADALDNLIHQIETYVLAEVKTPNAVDVTFSFDVPATWFQHLKAAWMRPWILRRWPVRYVKVTRTATVVHHREVFYPEASIAPPEFGRAYLHERWEGP